MYIRSKDINFSEIQRSEFGHFQCWINIGSMDLESKKFDDCLSWESKIDGVGSLFEEYPDIDITMTPYNMLLSGRFDYFVSDDIEIIDTSILSEGEYIIKKNKYKFGKYNIKSDCDIITLHQQNCDADKTVITWYKTTALIVLDEIFLYTIFFIDYNNTKITYGWTAEGDLKQLY